eukprot:8418821-Prorocentrum_lima.AAC.1
MSVFLPRLCAELVFVVSVIRLVVGVVCCVCARFAPVVVVAVHSAGSVLVVFGSVLGRPRVRLEGSASSSALGSSFASRAL